MNRILPALSVLCAALILACGGDNDTDTDASIDTTGAGALATPTATAETSVPEEKPTEAATPAPSEISVANEPVSVETSDGVVLEGHLYAPEGPKRQAVVIVAPVEQSTWAESTQAFTSEGVAVLTFDPRGYGETGGEAAPESLAADAQLIARFVMSREYPLVYLFGVGLEGGTAAREAAEAVEELSGVVTYGAPGGPDATNGLSLGGDGTWDGEDVLAIPDVQQRVLEFVLGD